ncbi:MAG: diaminopimelate decarboxylase [Phycisphaerales bacterium]|nr:diaminopimelate decarboxylase [Phycisphaerales bacterium]
MDHFAYTDGRLRCENLDLIEVASRFGTPTYVYSRATLTMHYRRLAEAFAPLKPLICYSVKSCPNINILRELVALGSGMDVVSGGELHRARLAGCSPEKIVFAGVGKTSEEIADALGEPDDDVRGPDAPEAAPIGLFNVESEQELLNIAHIATALNRPTRAALRVNPDVDAKTHKYTTTGTAENKFGVDLRRARDFFRKYARHNHLRLCGVHIHIGSPVAQAAPYVEAITRVLTLIDELAAEGIVIDTLDIGGGFAADYRTGQSLAAADYAAAIVPLLRERVESGRLRIILEPGRFIVANAGVLLTRVQYVKSSGARKFIICDAGMHTIIRPALYEAFHFVWPANVSPQHEPPDGVRADQLDLPGLERCDVVGPICESADFLCQNRLLPPVARGDIIAVFAAGAYGMSMASRYNSHPLPAEVLIDGQHARVIRRRESYHDLVNAE